MTMTDEQKYQRSAVVISRHWDNPQITVTITNLSISLEMSLEDFINGLAEDISHPFPILTRNQLKKRLISAAEMVSEKAKEATATVV